MNSLTKTSISTLHQDITSTQRGRKVDTRESMFGTLLTCLMLATVLSPVVGGDCTVVINGANEPGPQAGGPQQTLTQEHKSAVRCGGGWCVLRVPPWSMQAERQGPSTM